MSVQPMTSEQQAAVTLRKKSVALSAGAGCGKTFVLTERFLSEFDPDKPSALRPDQVGQMVAITFTDAAAREMRERIRKRCYKQLERAVSTDAKATAYWTQMLRSLDAAQVSTIHSYCTSLIRAHAVEAKVDPQFGVLEQAEADSLAADVIDDALRERLAQSDPDTVALLALFDMSRLRGMLTTLLGSRDRETRKAWLERSPESLVEIWKAEHARRAPTAIARKLLATPNVQRLKRLAADEPSPDPKMIARCQTILTILNAWGDEPSPTAVAAEMGELREAAKITGVKQWHSAEAKEAFQELADKVRPAIKRCEPDLQFDEAAALEAATAGLQLLRVADDVIDRYTLGKRELQRLDFDDLLITAHQLLTDPNHEALRQRLSGQVRLLLVDEFQDTDPLQVALVKALCGDDLSTGKLFFVGDMKQSIYRFRGAQPDVFVDLQDEMPQEGRLPLSTNFRSQPAILNFVNALFHDELTDRYQPLQPSRKPVAPEPAIEFLWGHQQVEATDDSDSADDPDDLDDSSDQLRRVEARWIARRLRQLLDARQPIVWESDDSARPARPGDIALLFRALTRSHFYEQALQEYGIPYYLVGGSAFYAQQEIFDVVNLLRAIGSPSDAVSLIGVLRSPFFSLPDEAIFWLGQPWGDVTERLYAGTLPAEVDATVRRQIEFARDTLRRLRQIKDRVPVAELLEQAIALTGYDAKLLAEFLGERKLANLFKLREMARSFDAAGIFSLEDFIARLNNSVVAQPKEAFAAIHPEAGDVVRLMTIHHSKGLEFPVVVVPDLDRKSNGDRTSALLSADLGPLVALRNDSAKKEGLSSGLRLHKLRTSAEEEAEVRRLLYVATTRAADYLILSSCFKDLAKPGGSWTNLVARHFELPTGKLIAPLPAGYATPQVKVTLDYPDTGFKPIDGRNHTDFARIVAKAESLAAKNRGTIPPHAGPVLADMQARRQFSFSQLTGDLQRDLPEAAAADAGEYVYAEAPSSAVELGTLVHAVLADAHLVANRSPSPEEIERLVHRYAERQMFESPEDIGEARDMIVGFFQSPMAARLAAAKSSHTELEFLLGWPPGEVEADAPYLNGFIDRLWQDATSDWHILDFKTNRVTPENLASTAAKYEMQMLLYALAIEQNMSVSPKSMTLYFLRTGEEFSFAWNPDARRRVIEMVTAGIAAARSRSDAGSQQPV